MGSFSQTLFFGEVKRQPEIRLRSQATSVVNSDRMDRIGPKYSMTSTLNNLTLNIPVLSVCAVQL